MSTLNGVNGKACDQRQGGRSTRPLATGTRPTKAALGADSFYFNKLPHALSRPAAAGTGLARLESNRLLAFLPADCYRDRA